MTRKLLASLAASALMVSVSSVHAGSDSGFYLGGAIGSTHIDYTDSDPDLDNFDFEDDDAGYKAFAGFNFGLFPMVDIAAELAYIDFGSVEDTILNTPVELDTRALSGAGIAGLKLGLIGLFGKVGVVNWDTDLKSFNSDESADGTDPFYGVGAKIQLGSLAVRAEYEAFELDDVEIDYYSLGASITF